MSAFTLDFRAESCHHFEKLSPPLPLHIPLSPTKAAGVIAGPAPCLSLLEALNRDEEEACVPTSPKPGDQLPPWSLAGPPFVSAGRKLGSGSYKNL